MQLGEPAANRIAPAAAKAIRRAVDEVGGREVFFAGRLDADGVVTSVRVRARGHEDAVPAIIDGLGTRDVVVHNHPGGDIAPSEADLGLASLFGFQGHGVYIVDNAVERVYVVVEPFVDEGKTPLDTEELRRALGPAGRLADVLPGFEVRPQQLEMMEAVAKAFNGNGIAVIEAPTGVGKTMSYLLPAVLWAVRNRERVVISTRTINLQEQIILKDIPMLAKCLDVEFKAVLVKGRNNYLCLRKLQRARSEASLYDDEGDAQALEAIAEWAETTQDGSKSDLPFMPPKEVWERVCSEADTCRISNCPDPKRCHIGRARRDVAKADIVVVNHHMLFADLAVKKEMGKFSSLGVLPAYKRLILDEAHSVEDSATEYFGMRVTRFGALSLLGRFIHDERGHERGLVPYVKLKLMRDTHLSRSEQDEIFDLIDNQLLPSIAIARDALATTFDALRHLTAERCGQIGRDIKWRLTDEVLQSEELRDLHQVYVLPAAEDILACARYAGALRKLLKPVPAAPGSSEPPFFTEVLELEGYRNRLERLAAGLAAGTAEESEANTVRWIEIDGKNKNIVRVVKCPLHVGKPLAEWVYANLNTVVMTSATLSVRQRFDYLFERIGLDLVSDRPVDSVILDSPFDFQQQALLCIPTDISPPSEKGFLEEMVAHIRRALAITRGHAFVLFTSFYALDYAHRRLEDELKDAAIAPLKQGTATRTRLLDRFRADPSSVLFATDSFWEGVDVAGEALQCVILPKLPFRVPTEPILEARAEAIEAAGGNSFMEFAVPQAVIKFRQGFGRLIRRRTDRGVILVLDQRVVTKYYGKVFLDSLPGVRVIKGPARGVYQALEAFFEKA
ncbi:MAG: DEAD/DEAH box helicase family protein [Candidatus Hydrogenedentes bacterium]|nr:DEAD/DEAH box helicase family protein [Candidatus Hydrogenedentota bacterium]